MVELPGVVLITGAASGIDRATALAFAQAGCGRLTLVDLNREGLDTTKSLILVSHPDAQVDNEVGNTTLQAFTEHMVTNTVSTYGRLDYAVNCAGTIGPPALSHEVDLEEYDRIMNVNHRGTFLSSRAELRAMIGNESSTPDESQSQRGAIVNVASTWGMDGARGFSAYCASKGAIISMTKTDALDYSSQGVRINYICPGLIHTPLATFNDNPEVIKKLEVVVNDLTPMRRMGRPEEIANSAVFLCSQRVSFIQGHALVVDGGLTAQ